MEKYEKLFKGLEMCAGPDCSTDCPYHGETRGGKTCRARLLNDAAVALASEESRAEGYESECEYLRERTGEAKKPEEPQEKPEFGLAEAMEAAMKATMRAEYWRGQADAMKGFLRELFEDCAVEADDDV